VYNPPFVTGVIHVYGGDFIANPRSQRGCRDACGQPYDLETVRRESPGGLGTSILRFSRGAFAAALGIWIQELRPDAAWNSTGSIAPEV
jgi:hypothetical protein